jgi:hypothetical protein
VIGTGSRVPRRAAGRWLAGSSEGGRRICSESGGRSSEGRREQVRGRREQVRESQDPCREGSCLVVAVWCLFVVGSGGGRWGGTVGGRGASEGREMQWEQLTGEMR